MNNWKQIESESDLHAAIEKSASKPQILFKHSVSCGISAHAKQRLESGNDLITAKADFHYLDLLRFRSISNLIAQELDVVHQSPQIIVLKNGKATYNASHHNIDPKTIAANL